MSMVLLSVAAAGNCFTSMPEGITRTGLFRSAVQIQPAMNPTKRSIQPASGFIYRYILISLPRILSQCNQQ